MTLLSSEAFHKYLENHITDLYKELMSTDVGKVANDLEGIAGQLKVNNERALFYTFITF